VSHETIEKEDSLSFSLQKHSHNFWLAFIIPEHHHLRKSMLGAAESRMQIFQSVLTGFPVLWKVLPCLLLESETRECCTVEELGPQQCVIVLSGNTKKTDVSESRYQMLRRYQRIQ